jgi:hypothetical protein
MDLRAAVKKTIAYSAYFHFPLSPAEIHYWLISSRPVSFSSLKKFLLSSKTKDLLYRQKLARQSEQKESLAYEFIKIVRLLPTVRLIALSGSVAIGNTQKTDDLDLFIITSPHTLWLTRPLILIILSIKFNRRHPRDSRDNTQDLFCPNLWLDTSSLSLPKNLRSLYTAHEVLQVKPLFDRGDTYAHFVQSNSWVKKYLANAYQQLAPRHKRTKEISSLLLPLLIPLNLLFFLLQYLYMLPKKTSERVTLHSAFFHKTNPAISLEKYLKNKSL